MNQDSVSNAETLPQEAFDTTIKFPDGNSVDIKLDQSRYTVWAINYLKGIDAQDNEDKEGQKDRLVPTILNYGSFEDLIALFNYDNELAHKISNVIIEKFFEDLDSDNWNTRVVGLVYFYKKANEGHVIPIIDVNVAIDKIISMEEGLLP